MPYASNSKFRLRREFVLYNKAALHTMPSMIQVSENVSLSLQSVHELRLYSCKERGNKVQLITIQGFGSVKDLKDNPMRFAQIAVFQKNFIDAMTESIDQRVIFCAGDDDTVAVSCAVLLGSMKILIDDFSVTVSRTSLQVS